MSLIPSYSAGTTVEKMQLSCGFYDLIDQEGPISTVAIRSKTTQLSRASRLCRRRIGELSFIDVEDRGMQLPPFKFTRGDVEIIYAGEWRLSKPHGRGELYFPNGDFYQGTFDQGIAVGIGRLIRSDGSYFQGDVIEVEPNGRGTSFDARTSTKYEGFFKNGKPHGQGREVTGSQRCPTAMFVGEYVEGYRYQGTRTWGTNGEYQYNGRFERGRFSGNGILLSQAGEYKGQFRDDQKQGSGVMLWKDGRKYIGKYSHGAKNGYGELYNKDGTPSYKGWWLNDYPNGQGIAFNGTVTVEGVWRNGCLKSIKKL